MNSEISLQEIFKNTASNYNSNSGSRRGLKLNYNMFTCSETVLIFHMEITNLNTKKTVLIPSFLLPGKDPEDQILRTLNTLDLFAQIITEF